MERDSDVKRNSRINRLLYAAAFVLLMVCVSGCGKGNTANEGREGLYFMLQVEPQEYAPFGEDHSTCTRVASQFFNGETVQILSDSRKEDDNIVLDIYLLHENGDAELWLSGINKDYRKGSFFLGQDGALYFLGGKEYAKLDRDGNELYRRSGAIMDICQTQDGSLIVLVLAGTKLQAAEMDGDSGKITATEIPLDNATSYLGTGPDGVVLMDPQGFWSLNLAANSKTSLMDFAELSYELKGTSVWDFQMGADGKADLLRPYGIEHLKHVDISDIRKIVIFRDQYIDSDMRSKTYNFNQTSEEYYVVFEEYDNNTDANDFFQRTAIDIATGKGADIITSGAIWESDLMDLIQKGSLEDLTPYLKKSKINREDYFPSTFNHWAYDGKIYGVEIRLNPAAIWIDEEVLGGREVPDVETLVSKMLAYTGDKKWLWKSDWILQYLLRGSENMWGLINRDEGTCDFEGEFFANMLKAAKQHGGDGDFSRDNISADLVDISCIFYDSPEKLELEGKVFVGFLFDDGAHALCDEYGTLAINGNSPNKDGAWAFISYLLDEEMQNVSDSALPFVMLVGGRYPVNITSFDQILITLNNKYGDARVIPFRSNKGEFTKEELLDPERHQAIKKLLEEASFAPIDNVYILDIILEEAGAYFSDSKSVEEVCSIIQNRVKLYLEENK